MKIVKHFLGVFEMTEEYDYEPTAAELYFWYGGTHTTFSRENPYRTKKTTVTKIKFTPNKLKALETK